MNMNLDDIPKNVLKWIVRREEPMLIMKVPRPGALVILTEDDPEIINAMFKAYLEIHTNRKENQKGNKGD